MALGDTTSTFALILLVSEPEESAVNTPDIPWAVKSRGIRDAGRCAEVRLGGSYCIW